MMDHDATNKEPPPPAKQPAPGPVQTHPVAQLPHVPDDCEIADIEVKLPFVARPGNPIETENVIVAGALHTAHQYAYRMRFFDAVDTAINLIDSNRIPLNTTHDRALANAIGCWQVVSRRSSDERVGVATARVLGFRNPAVPDAEHNTAFHGLMRDLVDAVNDVCRLRGRTDGARRRGGTVLCHAFGQVQANLAGAVSLGTALVVRHLLIRLEHASAFLAQFADHIPTGYLAAEARELRAAWWLNGTKLEADGIQLREAADTVDAWRWIYQWLAGKNGPGSGHDVPDDVCEAAAILRSATNDVACCCCCCAPR